MKLKKQNFLIIIIIVFLLGGGLTFGGMQVYNNGVLGGSVKIPAKEYAHYQQMNQRYGQLNQIYDIIQSDYYKAPNHTDLQTYMSKGLVAGLGDPYSVYMTKEEYDSWMAGTMGEFDGVGITFSTNQKGQMVVINTLPKSPAEKAGMHAGDLILAVDGKTYTDMDAAGAAMRGKAGTKVTITYSRNGNKETKTLVRAKIISESVTHKMLKNKIGYIRISAFEEHTAQDFATALKAMEAKQVKGLVIDLRENGGGLVEAGMQIANSLLDKGTMITYVQNRAGQKQTFYSKGPATTLPYAVLVDGGTASTSEILAAAIKDDGKHKLVGVKTFGKGIVQSTQTFKNGDALKLTVLQYFSPKGHTINKKGVTPDYVVKNSANQKKDPQLEKAIALLS